MKIETVKKVRYRNVDYIVDIERGFAFVPWVLRVSRASYIFLENRGMLNPIQEDLGLKTKLEKTGRFRGFINSVRVGFYSVMNKIPSIF